MKMLEPVIKIENLVKEFKNIKTLAGVSLEVMRGEIFAYLDQGQIVALDKPQVLINSLGEWALDQIHEGRVESLYFTTREAAAAKAAELTYPYTIRRVNLEDAFLKMTGKKLK
jgi:ABC-2 type transport system ATP-binding protein